MRSEQEDILYGILSIAGMPVPTAGILTEITITQDGTYYPQSGIDGWNKIIASVPGAILGTLNVQANGTYTPPTGTDGYNEVIVNVPGGTTKYDGPYSVTPKVTSQSLLTKNLAMTENVTINPIGYYITSNPKGNTCIIGDI